MIEEALAIAIPAFITLFVVIDPIGVAPIFATLTEGTSDKHRRDMAIRGTLIGSIVLFFFAFVGESFLSAMGITMPAFRVAGGLMLFLIAVDMVFEKRTERRERRLEEVNEEMEDDLEHEDISVFPIAIPFIAGPGSIGTTMLLMGAGSGDLFHQAVILVTLAVILILSLLTFLVAGTVMNWMGPGITKGLTRVLGIILAALAVQLIFDGITNAFLPY